MGLVLIALLWGVALPVSGQVYVYVDGSSHASGASLTVDYDTSSIQVNNGGSLTITGGKHTNLTINAGGNVTIVGAYAAHADKEDVTYNGTATWYDTDLTLDISPHVDGYAWKGTVYYRYATDLEAADPCSIQVSSLANITFTEAANGGGGPIEVDIAVPGSLNINGHGVIPVTIFGSDKLDVAEIDVPSLEFNGLTVRVKGKGLYHCAISDANEDGYPDLLCKFADDPEKWVPGQTTAKLTGNLNDDDETPIYGETEIRVVKEPPVEE